MIEEDIASLNNGWVEVEFPDGILEVYYLSKNEGLYYSISHKYPDLSSLWGTLKEALKANLKIRQLVYKDESNE